LFRTIVFASLAVTSFAPSSALAQQPGPGETASRDFGRFTLGLTGGFQYWSVTALEGTLDDRGDLLAQDGFRFESAAFEPTYAYAAEIQSMVGEDWFARAHFEWTRLSWGDRDLAYIGQLGSSDRTPVSLSYETKIRTNPVFVTLGAGRAFVRSAVRFGISANAIIAPLRVEDVIEVFIESETKSEVVAKGTGLGFEADFSIDYFTDVRTTLYVDVFGRLGSTTVALEEGYWESTSLPGKRRVDFDGAGLRLGFRWY